MVRARVLSRASLLALPLIFAACGRGIPSTLPPGALDDVGEGGGDGAPVMPDGGVIVGPDGEVIFVDSGSPFVPDTGTPFPFDASPIFDGGFIGFDADQPPPPFDGGTSPVDVGTAQCRGVRDCYGRLGQPNCPGGGGFWTCPAGACIAQCPMQISCSNDCDCPPELACGGGTCLPLNRNNQCCTNPFCPPGASCIDPNGGMGRCPVEPPPFDGGVPDTGFIRRDAGLRDGGIIVFDGGPPPFDGGPFDIGVRPDSGIPPVPVGAACMGDMMCGVEGYCIDESSGFPGGYCSQQCGRGRPCPSGSTCRNTGGGGGPGGGQTCLDDCATNTDCRMGYGCVQLGTNTQRVCWPVPEGSMNPMGAPVGSACNGDEDCSTGLSCFDPGGGWNGGYCTRYYCDPQTNPCPGGTQCYAFPGLFSLCLATCPSGGSQSTCRQGYYCLGPTGAPGVCISN